MLSEKMKKLVQNNSVVREMFEEGNRLAKKYGKENVYDFSIGNPNVEAPKGIGEAIKKIVDEEESVTLHGYMSNAGFEDTRKAIADNLNKRFDTEFKPENLIMTVGAAAGINIVLKSIINPEDEVVVFAPYFMEYNNYIDGYDAKVVIVKPDTKTFMPNITEFEQVITNKTKAVIINTPNNPTGVIYGDETLKEIAQVLNKKSKEYGNQIYLISDEPYRELAYDNVEVPFVTKYYNNTFVVYSYSKSLSLPGERIGYVLVSEKMEDFKDMIDAVAIANRIIGAVNAPSLIQKVIRDCVNENVNIEAYNLNRELLYNKLIELGFECVKPQGAFYLFMKTPIEDDKQFAEIAKKYNILIVPGSAFMCPGYVRIAYCVSTEMIKKSLSEFEKLSKEFFK